MSTRSRIGILNSDGSIDSVYHHFDGYPEWLGVKLKRNYKTSAKVRALIEGGGISCIESYQDWDRNKLEKPIVLTYAMRGETDCKAAHHEDLKDFLMYDTCQTEFSYLWNGSLSILEWTCWKANFDYEWRIPKAPEVVAIPSQTIEEKEAEKKAMAAIGIGPKAIKAIYG
jgi:hypothetical protein